MMTKKICVIIGTRAQLLKVDKSLGTFIINSGQHWDDDLAGQHIRERKLKPKYNLNIPSQKTGRMLDEIRPILQKEKPDIVVVYGDTNSTAAGAWAAALENIPVAHIEAGLRSGDRGMKEEVNRVIADHLATWKFCPTVGAYDNLLAENIGEGAYVVGDALFDSLSEYLPIKKRKDKRKYVFASIHREENLEGDKLKAIVGALAERGEPVIFSLHPRTRRVMRKLGIKFPANIEFVKPMNRKQTLEYISNARMVVTDSGGVQREAYWCVIPAIIPRPVTEWKEIVEDGWATLTGANKQRILDALKNFMPTDFPRKIPKFGANEKIRHYLLNQ